MARILSFIFIAVVIAVAVVWLVPLDTVLSARGFSAQEIIAMKSVNEPQPDAPCLEAGGSQTEDTGAGQDLAQSYSGEYNPNATPPPQTQASPERAPNPAPEPDPAPPPARKIVATATVNVRAGAGTNFNVVGQFNPREVVTVVEDPDGDWLKVKGDAVTGWVYRPLFDKK